MSSKENHSKKNISSMENYGAKGTYGRRYDTDVFAGRGCNYIHVLFCQSIFDPIAFQEWMNREKFGSVFHDAVHDRTTN
jgi:hypothetical protein